MSEPPQTYLDGATKRAIGVAIAIVLLVLLLPLWPLAAMAVRVGSPGPTFYRQRRTGQHGVEFEVIKLRTMHVGTTPVDGDETAADDPRISPAGRWLRRCGLDELPQLVNVLRGEMALVGPRPLLPWENARCDVRHRRRLLARPGITGLAQVMGRNRIGWAERIEWDVRYVEQASLSLDARVCLLTLPAMLRPGDAYAAPAARVAT